MKFDHPIIVDQRIPMVGSLQTITGKVVGQLNDSLVYSVGRESFWNISTDSLAFVLNLPNSDGDGRDESLINGYITFVGRLGTDIESIGSELPIPENRITQNRFANNIFRISMLIR